MGGSPEQQGAEGPVDAVSPNPWDRQLLRPLFTESSSQANCGASSSRSPPHTHRGCGRQGPGGTLGTRVGSGFLLTSLSPGVSKPLSIAESQPYVPWSPWLGQQGSDLVGVEKLHTQWGTGSPFPVTCRVQQCLPLHVSPEDSRGTPRQGPWGRRCHSQQARVD